MKRHGLLAGLGLALTLLMLGGAAGWYNLPFTGKTERAIYDAKLRLFMPEGFDQRIVILDIDEASLAELGRWPWPRNLQAKIVDRLFSQGVAVLGYDVVFPESDESSGLNTLEALSQNQLRSVPQFRAVLDRLRPSLEYDRIFAASLKGRKVALGYYFSTGMKVGALPPPALPSGTFAGHPSRFDSERGYGANLEILQREANGGFFNAMLDEDGIIRRSSMLLEFEGGYYESLSLAVTRMALGNATLTPVFGTGGELAALQLHGSKSDLTVPMDVVTGAAGKAPGYSTLIPFRWGWGGTFLHASVSDILHDRLPQGMLRDKIVLIGTTAPGLQDLRATPFDPNYPGVEVHASLIAGMLDQDFKRRTIGAEWAGLGLVLLLGAVLSLWLPYLSPVRLAVVVCVSLLAVLLLDGGLWKGAGLDLPVAHVLLLVLMLFVLNMLLGYLAEARRKRQITALFGQYVPTELVEEMSHRPESVSMESESREITILFSDIRGFTTLSETMDPRELSQMMNAFLTAFTRVIHRHRGTIDKYMGDCIMAFWGAPLRSQDHARDAVLAGLDMFRELETLRAQFKARGWPELRMGVGINTGRVSVGNMGSELRVAYTVMGDAVNLASRLEGITKQYRVDFIVGEATRAEFAGAVYRELDLVRVKGKDRPVAIYQPMGVVGELPHDYIEEISLHHEALRCYRAQDWAAAELQFRNLLARSPGNRLYQVFLDRIEHYRSSPPGEKWDGVHDWEIK